MKQYLTLHLLALTTIYTIVRCSDQAALQEKPLVDLQQTTATCNYQYYAAIGDSYSAGLNSWWPLPLCNGSNANNCSSQTCARNTGAYGYQFANVFRNIPNFQFLACSSANTSQIVSTQVPLINPNTELVTLTAGGDNGDSFANIVRYCVYESYYFDCDKYIDQANKTLSGIDASITQMWQAIKTRAPRARIVHMGYVPFWPTTSSLNTSLCQDYFLGLPSLHQISRINALIFAFNAKIAALAPTYNVGFAVPDLAFQAHRFCDRFESWFTWRVYDSAKTYYGGVFHPNQDGQNAYLGALKTIMGCSGCDSLKQAETAETGGERLELK